MTSPNCWEYVFQIWNLTAKYIFCELHRLIDIEMIIKWMDYYFQNGLNVNSKYSQISFVLHEFRTMMVDFNLLRLLSGNVKIGINPQAALYSLHPPTQICLTQTPPPSTTLAQVTVSLFECTVIWHTKCQKRGRSKQWEACLRSLSCDQQCVSQQKTRAKRSFSCID